MRELSEERRSIKTALGGLQINAWVYEDDAGARPETIEQTYLDELEHADLYLGIFWRDFGQYTIEEYEYAEKRGKDRLVYEKRTDLAGKRDQRLQEFLDRIGRVKSGISPARFASVEELVQKVVQDVPALLTARFRKQGGPRSVAPFQVREPDASFVPRGELEPLCQRLVLKPKKPQFRVLAVHGMPGSGKSELAVAAAHDGRVRERYADGVLWGVLGFDPDLPALLSGWIRALGDNDWRIADAAAS